jgi:peroxiredoxin
LIQQLSASAKKPLIAILLLAGLFFLLALISTNTAPDITFTTITGKKIALNQLRGKTVIVTFWATNCPGCIKEIPHLLDLYRQYHASGLEIIAVAMAYDPPSHVVAMTQTQKLPYDVVLDLKSEYAMAFGNVQFTPSTFLIGPEGSIVMKKTGLFDPAEMKALVEKLLKG